MAILILLFSLYPISRSVGSGDWFSVALLATLDVLMVGARIATARKVAALPPGDSDDPPRGVSSR